MKLLAGAASLLALTLFMAPVYAQDAPVVADQPATDQAAPAAQPEAPAAEVPPAQVVAPVIPDEILALLADSRPASELSDEELNNRAKLARKFAKDENLPQDVRGQLQAMAENARGEIDNRKQAKAPEPKPEEKAPVAEQKPAQDAAPAEAPQEQAAAPAIPDEVTALLNDGRSLAEIDAEELQQRVKSARRFAKDKSLPKNIREKLNTLVQDSRVELAKRETKTEEPAKQEQAAPAPEKKPVEAAPVEAAQAPAATTEIPANVAGLIDDQRSLAEFSVEELQQRAKTARGLSQDEQLPKDVRQKLAAIAKDSRAELAKREASAQTNQEQSAPVAEPAPPVAEVAPKDQPAIVQEAPAAADVAQPAVAPQPPQAPNKADIQALDNNAGDPALEKEARAYLDDATPLENLSDEDLRNRLDGIRDVMAGNKLSRPTEDAVRAKLKAERDVLRVRIAQKEAAAKAKAEAAAQLAAAPAAPVSDKNTQDQNTGAAIAPVVVPKPAPAPITDPAVIKALAALPPVPAAPPVPPPLPPIAVTNNTTINNTVVNNVVVINAATPAPVVLRDRRPPEDLQLAELQRRVQVYDDAQYDEEYDQEYRDYWRASVRRDREILRRRLIEERYRRQQQLSIGFGNDNLDIQINIDLAPDRPPPPRYVFAAEVDEAELENVLVAPPRVKPKRRYSVDEIAVQPKLRDTVSRIEIDTIKFGYNESFVREEQLQSLDGIAAIIERIVKKYPNEVFLIEGHTDAPGSAPYNVQLSKLRAESIKKALVSYYVIPAKSLRTVGLGERFLKIPTAEAEPENRRVSISRITNLLSAN